MKPSEMQTLYYAALAAGREAGAKAAVVPMVVQDADLNGAPVAGGKAYYVESGVCGFASVRVTPGNCRFANWLKKRGFGRLDSYAGGVRINVSEYNQSLTRKEAHAQAMADVLRAAGINAYADSRMD